MRLAIVVDAPCDLPTDYFRQHDIHIVPVPISLGGQHQIFDDRNPPNTLAFHTKSFANKNIFAETLPVREDNLRQAFLSEAALECDHVVCITSTAKRTANFSVATQTAKQAEIDGQTRRQTQGKSSDWSIQVINSESLFTGHGVLVAEIVRACKTAESIQALVAHIDRLKVKSHTYLIPKDLYYIRTRGKRKGENSVSWIAYTLGKALHICPILHLQHEESTAVAKVKGYKNACEYLIRNTIRHIEAGLEAPFIAISYSGPLAQVNSLPGYQDLIQTCKSHNIRVLRSVMSMTAGTNVGSGALSIGFVSNQAALR